MKWDNNLRYTVLDFPLANNCFWRFLLVVKSQGIIKKKSLRWEEKLESGKEIWLKHYGMVQKYSDTRGLLIAVHIFAVKNLHEVRNKGCCSFF